MHKTSNNKIFVAIIAIPFCLSGCAQAVHYESNSKFDAAIDLRKERIIHPILRTEKNQSLGKTPLSETVFSELNNYSGPSWIQTFKPDFLKAEEQALAQLCDKAVGLKTNQLQKLVGTPFYQAGSFGELESATQKLLKPSDEVWRSRFGINSIPVVFIFRANKCVVAASQNKEPQHDGFLQLSIEISTNNYHPMLHLNHPHKPDQPYLNQRLYLKLNDFSGGHYRPQYADYFGKEEMQVAIAFSVIARGLTKAQVEELAGPPSFHGGKIPYWNFGGLNEDTWIYYMGGSEIPVRLAFSHGMCSSAEVVSSPEMEKFQNWRVKQFRDFALGKTQSELESVIGKPAGFTVKQSNALDELWRKFQQQETLDFCPPHPEPIYEVTFRKGRCIDVVKGTSLIAI